MAKDAEEIRVVLLQEGDVWVAQCLEYDIGAQASDVDTLLSRLNTVLAAERLESERRGLAAFEGLPTAPEFYQDLWAKAAFFGSQDANGPLPNHDGLRLALCA